MADTPIPTPPRIPLDPANRQAMNVWTRWFEDVWKALGKVKSIVWSMVDKTGSKLTDIETRNHADLQNILVLDPGNSDATQDKHISNAQGKVWQDHTEDVNLVAHAANKISNTPSGRLSATDVQGAIDELGTEMLAFKIEGKEANISGLSKGQVVSFAGGDSGKILFAMSDNTNANYTRIAGLLSEDCLQGADCAVISSGMLSGVDTRPTNTNVNPLGETWLEGDLLWMVTGGGMSNVRPTSGRCIKVARTVKGSNEFDTLISLPFENPVWSTAAAGEDVVLRLGDDSGVNKVSIRDYYNDEIASINSDGEASFTKINGGSLSGVNTGDQDISGLSYLEQADTDRLSTGLVSGGVVTANLDGTINISAGVGYWNDGTGGRRVTWDAISNMSVAYGYSYIAIDSAGSPTNIYVADYDTYIMLAYVASDGVYTFPVPRTRQIGDLNARLDNFIVRGIGALVSDGLEVTELAAPNQLYFNIDSGTLLQGLSTFNVASTSYFSKLINCLEYGENYAPVMLEPNKADVWYYNVPTNPYVSALALMTDGYWKRDFITAATDGSIYYVYGTAEYPTRDEALLSPTPLVPSFLQGHTALLAAIVIQKGVTSIGSTNIMDLRPIMARLFGYGVSNAASMAILHSTLLGLDYASSGHTGFAATSHNQDASTINAGTLDGDRLPGLSTTKRGGVPATGTPSGKFLKDDGTWAAVTGGGTPGDTVVTETAFGQSSAAGGSALYSRADHTHGTPANPVTAHESTYNHTNYNSHLSNTSNPHSTTGDQVLPTQTGNSGKFLTTNGSVCSWATVGGGPGGLTLTTVEINLGTKPRRAGKFSITTVGLTTGKPVLVRQAMGPYTGHGTLASDAGAEKIVVVAKTTSTTNIDCFWESRNRIAGNYKFDYVVSA